MLENINNEISGFKISTESFRNDVLLDILRSSKGMIGRVISSTEQGNMEISLAGRRWNINVEPDSVLPEGARFNARLVNVSGSEKIELKPLVVESEMPESTDVSSQTRADKLTLTLKELNLPDNQTYRSILEALILGRAPLSKETIQVLGQILGSVTKEQIDILGFMFQRGIPVSPDTLSGMTEILNANFSIGEEVSVLLKQLETLVQSNISDELKIFLNQLASDFEGAKFSLPTMPELPTSLADLLSRLVESSGLDLEHKILNLLDIDNQQGQDDLASIDLKARLLNLRSIIANELAKPDIPVTQRQSINNIFEQTERLISSIESRQVRSLLPNDATRLEFYVQAPLANEKGFTTLEMIIRGDRDKKGGINPDNTEVAIILNMESLGKVRADVKAVAGNLRCDFQLENDDLVELFDEHIGNLNSALSEIDYKNVQVNCSIANKKEKKTAKQQQDLGLVKKKFSNIDLKV